MCAGEGVCGAVHTLCLLAKASMVRCLHYVSWRGRLWCGTYVMFVGEGVYGAVLTLCLLAMASMVRYLRCVCWRGRLWCGTYAVLVCEGVNGAKHLAHVLVVVSHHGLHGGGISSHHRSSCSRNNVFFTLSPPNKLFSAKHLVSFNFQSNSSSHKIGINVVLVSNRLGPDVTPSYSASHPDPSCLHIAPRSCLAG